MLRFFVGVIAPFVLLYCIVLLLARFPVVENYILDNLSPWLLVIPLLALFGFAAFRIFKLFYFGFDYEQRNQKNALFDAMMFQLEEAEDTGKEIAIMERYRKDNAL